MAPTSPGELGPLLALHLDRVLETCRRTVEDLTLAELNHQPSDTAHSIGWDVWHVVRTVDNVVFFVFHREQPVWLRDAWNDRFGLPRVAQGTGMTDEEARALRFPEPSEFAGYIDAVREAAVARLQAMSDEELAVVTTLNPWGERAKADHALQVLIAHGNGHLGKCSLARALLGKDDLGF
jgi:hypothetical protein